MAAKRHTHKYHRVKLGRISVWACALTHEDCTHHIPNYMENAIINRKSICWECDSEFVLDENSILADKPKCKDCRGVGKIESILIAKLSEAK